MDVDSQLVTSQDLTLFSIWGRRYAHTKIIGRVESVFREIEAGLETF